MRYLVIFRSRVEEPADIHAVGVGAESSVHAIREALRRCPPMHPWVLARAWEWPKSIRGIENAAQKIARVRVG